MFYKESCGRTKQLKFIWGEDEYEEAHKYETFHHDPVNPHAPIKPDKPEKPKPTKKVPKFGDSGYWTYIIHYYLDQYFGINDWAKNIIDFLQMFNAASDKFFLWALLGGEKDAIFRMLGLKR